MLDRARRVARVEKPAKGRHEINALADGLAAMGDQAAIDYPIRAVDLPKRFALIDQLGARPVETLALYEFFGDEVLSST